MRAVARRWIPSLAAAGLLVVAIPVAANPVSAACLDFIEVDGQVFVRVGFAAEEPLVQTNLLEQVDLEFFAFLVPLEETAPGVYTGWLSAFPAEGGSGIFQIADVLSEGRISQTGVELGADPAFYPDAPECVLATTARVPGTVAATGTTVPAAATSTVPTTIITTTIITTTTTTLVPGSTGGSKFPVVPVAIALVAAGAAGAAITRRRAGGAGLDTLERTGIPIHVLIDASEGGMGWSAQNVADVGPSLEAASHAVAILHDRFPSAVADTYGNGTLTNIEDTVKWFGTGDLERGCLSHQRLTYEAARRALDGSSLEVAKVRIGTVLEHNAVVVYPKGTDWQRTGIVLDGWVRQKSALDKMVYTFPNWVRFGDRPRLVD